MKTDTKRTKPTPRARRMWANYYPEIVCVHHTRKSAGASGDPSYPHAVPVAVIPLDDVEALQSTAYNAYCEAQDANRDSMECVVAALTAIGVLPKQRKGGRK